MKVGEAHEHAAGTEARCRNAAHMYELASGFKNARLNLHHIFLK